MVENKPKNISVPSAGRSTYSDITSGQPKQGRGSGNRGRGGDNNQVTNNRGGRGGNHNTLDKNLTYAGKNYTPCVRKSIKTMRDLSYHYIV